LPSAFCKHLSEPARPVFAALMALGISAPHAAKAQENRGISVELNRLAEGEKGCRMSLVFTNRLAVRLEDLQLETVLFDPDGRAGRFLVLKSQPLIPGKVRVQQYDLGDTRCEDIGSVLINDVIGCEGEGLTPAVCLQELNPSSREKAGLFLTIFDQASGGKSAAAQEAE